VAVLRARVLRGLTAMTPGLLRTIAGPSQAQLAAKAQVLHPGRVQTARPTPTAEPLQKPTQHPTPATGRTLAAGKTLVIAMMLTAGKTRTAERTNPAGKPRTPKKAQAAGSTRAMGQATATARRPIAERAQAVEMEVEKGPAT